MKKQSNVRYEWVVWVAPNGDEDYEDTVEYYDTRDSSYKDAAEWSTVDEDYHDDFKKVELRRQVWGPEHEGWNPALLQEDYAFVKNGALPEFFTYRTKVPKRFQKEVAEYHKSTKTGA